jgi:hypothetical protein
MSDISQLGSRVGGGRGSVAKSPHITTLPGSGRGAGRGVAFPPLGLKTEYIPKESHTSATPRRKCAVAAIIKEDK